MRRKIWLQFHMGTIALLALLTIANIVTALRPFSSSSTRSSRTMIQLSSAPETATRADRTPASSTTANHDTPTSGALSSKAALKIVQIPCDSNLRLRVFENVHSLRLQFEACPTSSEQPVRDVLAVLNSTNGFEGTVFGGTIAAPAGTVTEKAEHAGVFTSTETAATKLPKVKIAKASMAETPKRAPASAAFSTDFITLASGVNEIKIQRTSQTQILRIERK